MVVLLMSVNPLRFSEGGWVSLHDSAANRRDEFKAELIGACERIGVGKCDEGEGESDDTKCMRVGWCG